MRWAGGFGLIAQASARERPSRLPYRSLVRNLDRILILAKAWLEVRATHFRCWIEPGRKERNSKDDASDDPARRRFFRSDRGGRRHPGPGRSSGCGGVGRDKNLALSTGRAGRLGRGDPQRAVRSGRNLCRRVHEVLRGLARDSVAEELRRLRAGPHGAPKARAGYGLVAMRGVFEGGGLLPSWTSRRGYTRGRTTGSGEPRCIA